MRKISFIIVILLLITAIILPSGCNKPDPDQNIAIFNYLGVYPDWLSEQPAHNLNLLDSLPDDGARAVYLFRQASYNEIDCSQYVYFLDGGGNSVFSGANIVMRAQTIHIDNNGDSFHQMINCITEFDAGALNSARDVVSSFLARSYQRTYYNGQRYYRKGSNSSFDENNYLIAAWGQYEISQASPANSRADYDTEEEYLNARYSTKTFLNFGRYTDLLSTLNSNNLVLLNGTTITVNYDNHNNKYYSVTMAIDIDVANSDADTIQALKKDTGADDVQYSEFVIEFEIWENGLFKSLNPIEGWEGTIKQSFLKLNGGSVASNPREYSYHPDDCDLEAFLALLP